jgi:predicted DNA-binding protein (UPF0278 family)
MSREKVALKLFREMLEQGVPIAKAKAKSRIYQLTHERLISPEIKSEIDQLSEKYRMLKHTSLGDT